MSRFDIMSERAINMATRNGLSGRISGATVVITAAPADEAKTGMVISAAHRPCRVCIFQGNAQYIDQPWMELERRCRVMAGVNG